MIAISSQYIYSWIKIAPETCKDGRRTWVDSCKWYWSSNKF